jgi:hypothetical protein
MTRLENLRCWLLWNQNSMTLCKYWSNLRTWMCCLMWVDVFLFLWHTPHCVLIHCDEQHRKIFAKFSTIDSEDLSISLLLKGRLFDQLYPFLASSPNIVLASTAQVQGLVSLATDIESGINYWKVMNECSSTVGRWLFLISVLTKDLRVNVGKLIKSLEGGDYSMLLDVLAATPDVEITQMLMTMCDEVSNRCNSQHNEVFIVTVVDLQKEKSVLDMLYEHHSFDVIERCLRRCGNNIPTLHTAVSFVNKLLIQYMLLMIVCFREN